MQNSKSADGVQVAAAVSPWPVPAEIMAIVDGECVRGAGSALAVIDPTTEERVSTLLEDTPEDVDRAVCAARRALEMGPWSRMELGERLAVLRRIQRLIERHADELAYLDCLDTGVPYVEARTRKIPRIVENFEFAASLAGMAAGDTFQQNSRYLTYVTRQPVGVCAIIAPWNSPMGLASMQVAPCIALGNTCVVKPSEHASMSLFRLVQLLNEAGLPPGVVNLVNGRGMLTGEALVRHPGVNAVKFIGGTETGKRIMAAASGSLKRVGLELGGKSANIVFGDADFDEALDGALLGIYSNNGQQCLAGSRILVERSISRRFIEAFVARATAINVGNPLDPRTEVGPLAFEQHYQRVLGYVGIARSEGAELLVGGAKPQGMDKGYFLAPTAVLAAANESRVCQEEIFGPFASFMLFDSTSDAIQIANDSRFGLVSYVWSRDIARVMQVSQAVRAGTILVNTSMVRELRAPFGGFNESGVGRDGARHTLDFFTEAKTTTLPVRKLSLRRLGVPTTL